MASYEGGCQCGAVRYEASVDRLIAYACHCRECQKQSASAFGISVPVPSEGFRIEGPMKVWRRPTDSGSSTDCWFCESCGTRLYHRGVREPEWVAIKGGSLDDPDILTPIAHIWIKRKRPWLLLPPGVPTHDTEPDDYDAWLNSLTPK
ncbi:MAG: GFA family protein [Pseudomonadota bacterium]